MTQLTETIQNLPGDFSAKGIWEGAHLPEDTKLEGCESGLPVILILSTREGLFKEKGMCPDAIM